MKIINYFFAVISVLFICSCGNLSSVDTKEQKARFEMSYFAGVLASFREKEGRYPTSKEGLNSLTRKNEVLDPWGMPYIYISPASGKGGDSFFLYSTGPNKLDDSGKGDDIVCCSK